MWNLLRFDKEHMKNPGTAINLTLQPFSPNGVNMEHKIPGKSLREQLQSTGDAYRPKASAFDLTTRSPDRQGFLLRIDKEPQRPSSTGSGLEGAAEMPSSLGAAHIEEVPMAVGAEPEVGRVFASRDEYIYEGQMVGTARMKVICVLSHPGTEVALPLESSVPISLPGAVEALHNLPDMRVAQRLSLLDQNHPEQEWLRQTQENPNLTVNAEAIEPGEVRVYKPGLDNFNENVVHEWNHLLRQESPKAAAAFDQVGDIEPVEITVNAPFPRLANDEIWSYLGEHLASFPNQPADALMTALANPIRSTIWAKAVGDRMASLSEGERTASYESHQSLQRFIKEQVKPQAVASLKATAADGSNTARQVRAQNILNFLSGH
jgi:hypothetical protein